MNYLIFGGEGFIGRHLADYLALNVAGADDRIYSLDIRKTESQSKRTYLYCDVRKEIELTEIPELSNSIIFNLAAVHTTPGHPEIEYFEANIRGAENIILFAERHDIARIVFTSSIAPYGAAEDMKTEDTLPTPNTPYGISKLVAEHIFRAWQAKDSSGRKLSIVRPGVVFGKGEGGNFTRLYNAQKKGFFFFPGRKDTLKACVYVKDVVRILYDTSIQNSLEDEVSLFNLTYNPAPSIEKICSVIARETGVSNPRLVVPGSLLKSAASVIYGLGIVFGKKISGIHPARVRKLMISTNINGQKLEKSRHRLRFTLEEAIADWKKDCMIGELY